MPPDHGDGLGHQAAGHLRLGQVAGQEMDRGPADAQVVGQLPAPGTAPVHQDQGGAPARQATGDGAADAAGPAGDENPAASDFHAALPTSMPPRTRP